MLIKKEAKKKSVKVTLAKTKSVSKPVLPVKPAVALNLVRGMKDIIPPQGDLWLRMTQTAIDIATAYDFHYFETPVVEATSLFVRSLGRGTDVIDKEMYAFEDRDGGKICLRPEMTASVARSYIMQGMQTLSQPVKLWNIGPLFRYDRPQAGRYRQFHQFNCESFGVRDPAIDAELVSVAYHFLKDLGIASLVHRSEERRVGKECRSRW